MLELRHPRSLVVPLVFDAALAFVLGPCFFVGESWGVTLSVLVMWIALVLGVNGAPATRTLSLASAAVPGIGGAVLWIAAPAQWAHLLMAVGCRLVLAPSTRRERWVLSAAGIVPAALIAVTAVAGMADARRVLVADVLNAFPGPAVVATHFAAIAAALWLSVRCSDSSSNAAPGRSRWQSAAMAGVSIAALAAALFVRARATMTEVFLPFDAHQWTEPSLLMNVVKWREHIPLFSDPFEVRSYTLSPTFELLQAALLSPLHRSLDVVSHRLLVLGWQLGTAAAIAFALRRRLGGTTRSDRAARAALAGATVLALEWASPSSPYLHPDHGVHAAVAAAAVLLLVEGPPSKRVLVGLSLASVAAALFKLTGIGIGVGVGLVALLERRRDLAASVAVAVALVLASLPLYDALFGRFTEYAVVLMSRHPVGFRRLLDVPFFPYGRWIVAGLSLGIAGAAGGEREARRLALLVVGVGAFTTLALIKDAGRANNLLGPALPALALAFLWSGERPGRRFSDVASLGALAAMTMGPLPDSGAARARTALVDHQTAVSIVRGDLATGRRPLVLSGAMVWLDAGGQGAPQDQLHSAIELFHAGHPAFETFLARLASGTYDTIVAPGIVFIARTASGGPFGARLSAAVRPRYCVVYPVGDDGRPVPLTAGERLLVLRKRELGCDPGNDGRLRTLSRPSSFDRR